MHRGWYSTVLVLCAFIVGLGLLPCASWAQVATPTPTPSAPDPGVCTAQEFDAGDSGIGEWPKGSALVSPASSPNMDLYVVEVTVPLDRCVAFDGHYLHDGAIIWLVKSGKVQFLFRPIAGWPAPDMMWVTTDTDLGPADLTATLEPGEWVSADRAVNYSYRNAGKSSDGDGEAVIIMTVLEKRVASNEGGQVTRAGGGCKGVCRR